MYRYRRTARFRSFAHGALIADFSFFLGYRQPARSGALGKTWETRKTSEMPHACAQVQSSRILGRFGSRLAPFIK
ncbi:hypothetical protein BURPS305_5716 [Burkholderia pseudomallei 305]|nr:hypothetical protein BURPS305_5716 [Burkholderia pseudomallei 305]